MPRRHQFLGLVDLGQIPPQLLLQADIRIVSQDHTLLDILLIALEQLIRLVMLLLY